MSAAQMYDRLRAACCEHTGLSGPDALDLHARNVAELLRMRRLSEGVGSSPKEPRRPPQTAEPRKR